MGQMGEYVSTQTLVIHQWTGPSVVAQVRPVLASAVYILYS